MRAARRLAVVVLAALVPAAGGAEAGTPAIDAVTRMEQQLASPLARTMTGLAERTAADKEVVDHLWEVPALALALARGRMDLLVPSLRLAPGDQPIAMAAAPAPSWPLHYRLSLASGPVLRGGHPVLVEAACTLDEDGSCVLEILSTVPALATTTPAIPALAAGERWRIAPGRFIRRRAELAVDDDPVVPASGSALADLVSATGSYGARQAATSYARLLLAPAAGGLADPPLVVRGGQDGGLSWSSGGAEVLTVTLRSDAHGLDLRAMATPCVQVVTRPEIAYDIVIDAGLPGEVRRHELLPLPLRYPAHPRRLAIQASLSPDRLPAAGGTELADEAQQTLVRTRFRRGTAAVSGGECAFAVRLARACTSQAPSPDQARRFRGFLAGIAEDRERAALQARLVVSAVLGEDEAAAAALAATTAGLLAEAMPEFAWAEAEAAARWALAIKRPALACRFLRLLLDLEVPIACRIAQARRLAAGGDDCLAWASLEPIAAQVPRPEMAAFPRAAALRLLSEAGADALGLAALLLRQHDLPALRAALASGLAASDPDLARRLRESPLPPSPPTP